MTKKAKVWSVFVLLVCLNIFDYLATDLILLAGGSEANPIQQNIINEYGSIGILYLKAPFLFALGVILLAWNRYTRETQRTLEIGMFVCTTIYCLLAVWHCILMTLILHRAGM